MKQFSLAALFVKDHERIIKLLYDFKDNRHKQPNNHLRIFSQLSQAIKAHFKEEEMLYSKYRQKEGKIPPILQTIRKDHEFLLNRLEEIRQSIKRGLKADVSDIHLIIERHKNIEERLLYPELDNFLQEKEKEEVYWKMKVR